MPVIDSMSLGVRDPAGSSWRHLGRILRSRREQEIKAIRFENHDVKLSTSVGIRKLTKFVRRGNAARSGADNRHEVTPPAAGTRPSDD